MKLSLAFLLFAASTEAFAPATFGVRSMTQLASRVDSTSLVDEALAASKKFGASSKEARLAWEAVEEVDSSDNRCVCACGREQARLAFLSRVVICNE